MESSRGESIVTMADPENADIAYNNQLVRLFSALRHFHSAEYGSSQDAFSLYHLIQEEAGRSSSIAGGPVLPALGHAIAGSAATAASKLLIYPLDLIITRMQVQRQLRGSKEAPSAAQDADAEYSNLVDAAQKIYADEGGLRAFYTGCTPDVAKALADSFLFFLAYSTFRQYEVKRHGSTLPVSRELGVGVVAGALAKLVTTPLQNIITRQQTAALVSTRDPSATTTGKQSAGLTIKDIALQIRDERGLPGFWAGYSASLILTLNPAMTFAIDNLLHRLLPKARRENPGSQLTFLIAATSKVVATAITYPVSLAKSRAQVQTPINIPSNTDEKRSEDAATPEVLDKPALNATPTRRKANTQLRKLLKLLSAQYAIIQSLRRIYDSEGLGGLYAGLEGEVLKGFLSHGLTMVMKDRVHVGVIQLYYVLLRLTRRWPEEVQKAKDGLGDVTGKAREGLEDVRERAGEAVKSVAGGEKKPTYGNY